MGETEEESERQRDLQELYEEGFLSENELKAELRHLRNPGPEAADDNPGLLARLFTLPLRGAKESA